MRTYCGFFWNRLSAMMSRITTVSFGGFLKIVFCCMTVIFIGYLFVSFRSDNLHERSFHVLSTKDYDSAIPQINLNLLKHSNESENFVKALKSKYGSVNFSGVKSVSTKLTPEEDKLYQICFKNAATDRAKNGSAFWPKQQIRRSHHTYLKKPDAVMMEVGGNRGDDATEFVKLYNPRYLILEPLQEYADILTKKFKDNPKVTVVNLGLGEKNEVIMVKIEGNNACATSKFSGANGDTPLYVTNTTEFLLKIGLGMFEVDLVTMNCEGCEFEALEQLLSTNLVTHFKNIQWATHSTIKGIPDPLGRYCKIQQLLSRTHTPTYQYKFIWESWRRKDLL